MMIIEEFTTYTCDLGWRTLSFLKLRSADGVTGWSEFTESFGNAGLVAVVNSLRESVVGRDAMHLGLLTAELSANSSPVPGGINRQAIGAVENALYDLKARTLGVSVAELLGGRLRDRIPVYWSHCGTYRQGRQAQAIGVEPITSYPQLAEFARQVRARGFRYLKTNMIAFDDDDIRDRPYPWTRRPAAGGRVWDDRCIQAIEKTLAAFRDGAGDDVGIILDVNFGFGAEGVRRIEAAVRDTQLAWIEVDGLSPGTLADLRRQVDTPIASGESLFGRAEYLPFLNAHSVDIGIVDAVWNGIGESARIAAMAEPFSIEIAPHNFYGHLSTLISAHFAAVMPNLNILEVDIDGVARRDELVDHPPRIEDGFLMLPEGPGWGIDVNEAAVQMYSLAASGSQAAASDRWMRV